MKSLKILQTSTREFLFKELNIYCGKNMFVTKVSIQKSFSFNSSQTEGTIDQSSNTGFTNSMPTLEGDICERQILIER